MRKLIYTFLVTMLCFSLSQAQTVWTGAVDSDWTNGSNWSAGTPSSGQTVTIPGAPQGGNFPIFSGSPIINYTIQNGGTITFNTVVFNSGTIVNFSGATLVINDAFINGGGSLFDNDGILENNGTLSNYGNYDHAASAVLENANGSTFNNFGSFSSNGQINNSGLLNNAGTFSNSNGMTNTGTFDISGIVAFPSGSSIDNTAGATIHVLNGGTLELNGSLPNSGTILIDGELAVQTASTLTNDGTITNNNTLEVAGRLTNNDDLINNNILLLQSAGFIDNFSNLDNNGSIEMLVCSRLEQHAGNVIAAPVENGGLIYEISGTVNSIDTEFGDTFTNITDTQDPVPACKMDNVFVLPESGSIEITAEEIDRGRSYGSCGATLVEYDITPTTFTTADVGVRIVTLTITDNFGNTSSCDDFVTILPYLAPVSEIDDADIDFACPTDIVVSSASGAQFAEVSWTEPTATTTCSGGGSVIEIEARGNIGGENVSLYIGGTEVQSWTAIGNTLTTLQYTHSSQVAADDVQVHFTNDQQNGGDYNLIVDKIIVDGQAYETEDPSVFGRGVYNGNVSNSCSIYTNHQSEQLSCNGYFQYAGGFVNTECNEATIVRWNMNGCLPNTNSSYDEFTPTYPNGEGCQDITASNVYRETGSHACVAGRTGTTGSAQAVGTASACTFNDNDQYATRFEVTITPETAGQLTDFIFYERAPEHYEPADFAGGTNNYPTLYGVRILRDGAEIFKQVDISTSQDWSRESFDLTSIAGFDISSTATFAFEVRAYCRAGISASFAAWEIDDFILRGCCNVEVPACSAVTENIPGYTYLGELDNSKYFASDYATNWQNANSEAIALGGHLVSISSATENDFVQTNINPASGSIWTGLNTYSSPGVFNWQNGESLTYTNWAAGEPNGNGIEYGVRLRKAAGDWTDRPGSNNYEYVLEIPCPSGPGGGTGSNELTVTQIRGPLSGSNFVAGTTEVAYEVTDACGNQEICIFNVTVEETPADFEITSCPADIVVDTDPGATTASVTWAEPEGTSTCFRGGPIGLEQTVGFENGEDFPVGTSTILYAVFDSCGNFGQCAFNVVVNFVPASLTLNNCQGNEVITVEAGQGGSNVTWDVPSAETDCHLGNATAQQLAGPANGSFLPLGVTQIIYLISDDCGSTEVCIFNITVTELVPCANEGGDADGDGICAIDDCDDNNANVPTSPGTTCDDQDISTINDEIQADGCTCAGTQTTLTLACQADIIVNTEPGAATAVVNWTAPTSASDCTTGSVTVVQTGGPLSGDAIAAGTTTVSYEATDGCGNTSVCSFEITVNAVGSSIVLTCPQNINVTAPVGETSVAVSWADPIPTTDCTTPSLEVTQTQGPLSGSVFEAGVTVISYTATNGCGESIECIFSITVNTLACSDVDGDGFCANEDCDDNDASVPTTPGTACDDNDPNTTGDVIQADGCSCAGTSEPTNDCSSIVITTGDGSITVDGLSNAPITSVQIFNSTWNEVYNCAGNCDPTAEVISGLPVGNYFVKVSFYNASWQPVCAIEDFYEVTGDPVDPCENAGGDADGDGVCAADDCDDNDASIPAAIGSVCDDGDSNTINDVIGADGCSCAGVVPPSCDNAGGDADGDGVCADDDCDDNDASVPALPGTACDDNDPATSNDEILADGCTCQGTTEPTNDCSSIVITTGDGSITVDGLSNAPITSVQVFNNVFNEVYNCAGNCDPVSEVISGLPIGTYYVKISFYTASWQPVCAVEDYYDVTGDPVDPCENAGGDADGDGVCAADDCDDNDASIPAAVGSNCDDGDANTINDVIGADGCSCAGVVPPSCDDAGGDADGDGICADVDCDDNDASLPAAQGTACDDNDAATENDVIGADGCSCAGTPVGECTASVTIDGGDIVVSGLTSAVPTVFVFDASFSTVFSCAAGDCDSPTQTISGLTAGTYYVKVQLLDASWSPICQIEDYYTVGTNVAGYIIQEVQTFEAHKGQRNVELLWATNTEYKNASFEIERSVDGTNFETIKDLNSEEDGGEVRLYNTFDKDPAMGINYYRLKRISFDGSYEYSEVREVAFDMDLASWAVFPNPAVDQINVHLNELAGRKAIIEMYNNLGQRMTVKEFDSLPSEPIEFDLSTYKAGMYTVTVKVDGQRRMTKLFVVTNTK